jgi:hemerythrin-like domain-containing protein
MQNVIETLMHEHRVIERVLAALRTAAITVDGGADIGRETVALFAEFFAGFADRCHHGKEEDILFDAMVEAGFPREQGPIGVMLAEHVENRRHVGALGAIGRGSGPLSDAERRTFVAHALQFVPLLEQHIVKEDQVLYPMAVQALTPERLNQMAAEFDEFEAGVTGEGEHERLHALADQLIVAYPGPMGSPAPACCYHGHNHA